MKLINIIEPSLHNEAGHCYGYVSSVLGAAKDCEVPARAWIGKTATDLLKGYDIEGYFDYRFRKWQLYQLYRKLLKRDEIIFVPTAGRTDLMMLARLAKNKIDEGKVYLHFHQFKQTPKKLQLLHEIALHYPQFVIMTPTTRLTQVFEGAGFIHCMTVPCPSYTPTTHNEAFDLAKLKLIYTGAARCDKGFVQVVDFVEKLTKERADIRVQMQTSAPHNGRYEKQVEIALKRLQVLGYPHLSLVEATQTKEAYLKGFANSVCLLLYDVDEYHDKFSGVALDALYGGSPIVTVAGTWIADQVERFQAGIVIADRSPQTVLAASQAIMNDYQHYHHNAVHAGIVLEKAHQPEKTIDAITDHCLAACQNIAI